ncbi:MAG: pyruvate kinase [Cyanobacteria bacterium REEB459]|nr:pyruvate kinase [Cyanobacteria bacterium REEB459]
MINTHETVGEDRISSVELARSLRIDRVLRALSQLRQEILLAEQEYTPVLAKIAPDLRESAYNLVHYLALRRHDLRDLQSDLRQLGLSSLGRLEAHVMATLQAVLQTLYGLVQQAVPEDLWQPPPITFEVADTILRDHASAIFGYGGTAQPGWIMVTMPTQASQSAELVDRFLAGGMDIMRINCAHDTVRQWQQMVAHLRQAEARLGKRCRLCFDLAGPKLRTTALGQLPGLVKWHQPDPGSWVTVWLVANLQRQTTAGKALPVGTALLDQAMPGDRVVFTDRRGQSQTLEIMAVTAEGCRCQSRQKAQVTAQTSITLMRDEQPLVVDRIGPLPPRTPSLWLATGDYLRLVSAKPADADGLSGAVEDGEAIPVMGCEVDQVFRDVRPGDRIFLDDGIFAGIVRQVEPHSFTLELVSVLGGRAKLKAEKGINLPDTDLSLPALTSKDLEDLEFIANQGDLVALSFVQSAADIEELATHLRRLRANHLGIILKIETQKAFNHLPELLLTALQYPPTAVMVARGDLGVEVGFERLSEVQEEILWLCEAAHVPVIWATQVLETLAQGGRPSRAEVTDTVLGSRAECIMLNKGPYIEQAMAFLQDVWQRMQAHQQKKTAMLRQLKISQPEPAT